MLGQARAALVTRERVPALAGLILVTALAWIYLWREAALMGGTAGTMEMGPGTVWSPLSVTVTFTMWTVMMIGMMLPSAAPAILLYGTIVRRNAARGIALAGVPTFTAGYLAAWAVFALGATLMQLALRDSNLLTAGMSSASDWLTGGLLVVAGLYQWLPFKAACLDKCRNPLALFLTRWRPGRRGAFAMGLEHGTICVGCCWALMLLLFTAGVMNLLWVAFLAAFVFVEKLLPRGETTMRAAGIALVAIGLYMPFSG